MPEWTPEQVDEINREMGEALLDEIGREIARVVGEEISPPCFWPDAIVAMGNEIKARDIQIKGLEYELRETLWLRHGCVGLYGDDGEMQCGSCMIDFKRRPLEEIKERLRFLAMEKVSA